VVDDEGRNACIERIEQRTQMRAQQNFNPRTKGRRSPLYAIHRDDKIAKGLDGYY
jgi:hypothetical protein